ncbi:MAG: hypothetical protein RSD49_20630 [Hafnia sp.]
MIRKLTLATKPRIPAKLRKAAKNLSDMRFRQIQLSEPVSSIAKLIPYPVERQRHSLIVLGSGQVPTHEDDTQHILATSYCIPFHLPKNARLHQNYQKVMMVEGACYSFNQNDSHGVDSPEDCQTYAAFIVVDVSKKEL